MSKGKFEGLYFRVIRVGNKYQVGYMWSNGKRRIVPCCCGPDSKSRIVSRKTDVDFKLVLVNSSKYSGFQQTK